MKKSDAKYAKFKKDRTNRPTLEQIKAMYPGMIQVDIPKERNWNNADFRRTMDKAY